MSIYDLRVMIEKAIPLWVPIAFVVAAMLALVITGRRERKPKIDNDIVRCKEQLSRLGKRLEEERRSVKP